jgi:hypothetical protein
MENHGGRYRQKKSPDSSNRDLWQDYQQSHLVAKRVELAKELIYFAFQVSLSYFKEFINVP